MSSPAAQPPALSRWRRNHIHFSPERGRAERGRASPEWSVASDAPGGSGERGEPVCANPSNRGHTPSRES
ncbi:hypothetical protein EXE43_04350 [Halorubrum sp. SS5]|nr:hypothetical protein EXE43_04350 [Halorubrum sp. SS5]